ncbi:MAG: hypothetical protein GY804_08665 [Alphaproteobacteria bacterium]|nr:hypothetical protein [Alphaproteobacteria bacterium]
MSNDSQLPEIADFTNSKYNLAIQKISESAGAGGFYNTLQVFLTEIDRYKFRNTNSNLELTGLTFITRPKLNLSAVSLKQSQKLSMLNSTDPSSIQFVTRCLLDPKFADRHIALVESAPNLNHQSPFIPMLTNSLRSISGWPGKIMGTSTTIGGFHSENQVFAVGSDRLRKAYDVSMTFADAPNSIVLNLWDYWFEFIDLLMNGDVLMYPEDTDAQRMCYTFSVYRLMFSPCMRYTTSWCKGTGSIIQTNPIGEKFNFSNDEVYSQAAQEFSINCSINNIKYNEVDSLFAFNDVVRFFCPSIDQYTPFTSDTDRVVEHYMSGKNYSGIPYINFNNVGANGIELQFLYPPLT